MKHFCKVRRPTRTAFLAMAVLAAGVALAHVRAVRAGSTAHLVVLTELAGVTAPCGCTSRPLGGLDRIATAYAALKQAGPAALVSVGDTFFDPPPHAVALMGHRRATANIIASWLATLAPAWCVMGSADLSGAAEAGAAWQGQPLAVAHADERSAHGAPIASKRLTLGQHEVGLLAVAPTALQAGVTTTALADGAARLRAQGAHGVVLLWPFGSAAARQRLAELAGIDFVITGDDGPPCPAERLGSAVLLGGGGKGEHLGVLRLTARGQGQAPWWHYDDGGEMDLRPLRLQRDRFAAEVQRLPDGPAKAARAARVAALGERMAAVAAAQPKDGAASTVAGWQLRPIEATIAQAPWATTLLERYNDSLCDTAMAETGARQCAPAAAAGARYAGTQQCIGCHAEATAVHAGTAHARAWATLTQAHKACDLSCVGCHVVGWEQPGGFCHLADSAPYQNVGCESCHGPGEGHAQHPFERAQWAPTFVRNTPESTCRGCHNAEHSDQFDFATYRPRILGPGHGAPLR